MKRLSATLLCIISVTNDADAQVRASTLHFSTQHRPTPVPAAQRGSDPEYGSVRQVLDGDTYEVLLPAELVGLRLLRVDAPELTQPYGKQAAYLAAGLLRGRLLEVSRTEENSYGRTLAGLRVAIPVTGGARRWLSVDSLLVARGEAWAYEPGRTVPALAVLQQQAQRGRRGLWRCGTATAVRPGVWRTYNKQEKARAWVGCPGWPRE